MAGFIPMMGTYTYNLDNKNRIFIPAKHREALGDSFVIFPNPQNPRCLIISTVEYLDELINKYVNNDAISAVLKTKVKKLVSGHGDTLTTDTQGRVVIASSLVSYAGLGGSTTIHGCYTHAEIWNASIFEEITREEAESIAEELKDVNIVL